MENAIYSPLPQEVKRLSSLIDIDPGIGQTEDTFQEFVLDRIPRKDLNENYKYAIYNLYELIDTNKNKSSQNNQRGKCLNFKQKKALFDIKKEHFNFQDFKKINELWHSYFDSIVSEVKTSADKIKLPRADFHGAYFIVCASKNPSVIGLKGYVVQESKQTFRILNVKNRLLTIPKNATVFAFEHKNKLYKLNGYNIIMSSFNRSKIKPKFNYICEL